MKGVSPDKKDYFPAVTAGFTFVLLVSLVVSLAFGAVTIDPGTVFQIVWYKITGIKSADWPMSREIIVWQVRAPRALLSLIAGGGLAVIGAVMQAIVRNRMADPYLLGLSSGASTGAALAIYLGSVAGLFLSNVSLMAFLGSLAAFLLVFTISTNTGQMNPGRLILGGISVSFLFNALTSLLSFLISEHNLREITHWLLGSVASGKWETLALPGIVILLGTVVLIFQARELNVIAMGEETSTTLGVSPKKFRKRIFLITSAMTGVIVAQTGAIGFVGLMIPHFIRSLGQISYTRILPLCVLAGGIFLIWADVIARTIFSPEELPIGIVTAICGAPCFIWILGTRKEEC